jgi:molecular chaperone DnaK
VDLKNQSDGLIHSAEKNVKEHGEKIPADDKATIEKDIQSLRDAVASEDAEAIEKQLEALTQSTMKLGEVLYKAQQEAGGAEGGDNTAGASEASSGSNDSDVVDATFEEIDESKKKSN